MTSALRSTRDYPARPFLAVSIAVFRNGKVLLASRKRPPYEDIYTLPGGVVESGEYLAEAALRELKEEVGVVAHDPVFVGPVEVIERDESARIKHHMVIMVHAAFWKSGEPQTGPEAGDVCWVGLDEIDQLPITAGLKEILVAAGEIISHVPGILNG